MSTYIINDNGVEREMTAAETKAFDKTLNDTAKDEAVLEAEKQAKQLAKADVLAKLGLTADEVAALFA
jgi:ABC-type transport system involved in cytochrome c biogenesis ATPase subunit